ncbi:MAG: hypothetical protein QOJ59_5587, partial [Thermomicrobiales bacterium]|nr:hypothetical protein [Thermomicrobiales bacterium]
MNLGGDEAKSGALRFLEGRDQEVIDL